MDFHSIEIGTPSAPSAKPQQTSNDSESNRRLTEMLQEARVTPEKTRRTGQLIHLGYSAKRVAEIVEVPVWYCQLMKSSSFGWGWR